MGIGVWGLGIGDWAQSPIPNPQSPIPNQFINQKLKLNNSDFNIIHNFLIDILNNKNKFNLNTFFNLSNQLKLIRYVELNLKYFHFIYKKKRGIK